MNLTTYKVGTTYNFAFGYNTYNFNTNAYSNYYGGGVWFTDAIVIHSYNGVGIYNNSFNYTHSGGTQQYIKFIEMGALINHGLSYIKKNTFYNDIPLTACGRNDIGIYIDGNNPALNIKCNTFENLAYDIRLGLNGQLSHVPLDGGGSIGSGNTWSTIAGSAHSCNYSNVAAPSGHRSNIGNVFFENIGNTDEPKASISQTSWEHLSGGLTPIKNAVGTANTCAATTCEDLQVLAVSEIDINQIVTSFPNPTSADFTITTKQPIKYVTLYSADGRKLLEVKSNSTLGNEFRVNRVDLNNFTGIILIKVECLNGQVLTGRQILY